MAFVHHEIFGDVDAFVMAQSGSGGSVLPMAGVPWRASLSVLESGSLHLYTVDAPPQIRQGAVPPCDILMTSPAPAGAIVHMGHSVGMGDVSVVGAGVPIECRFLQPVRWSGVSFEADGLARLAEAWRPGLPRSGQHGHVRLSPASRDRMATAIETSIAGALRAPDHLVHAAAVAALEDRVVHAVVQALAEPAHWVEMPRATAARQRIAQGAVALLEASPAEDWTLVNLARRLGVSPRTLHGAFAAIYGCSPHAFIKRFRLSRVRRALLAQGEAMLVKTAALDHGFWHLGHFSIAYRAMFGESPHETRRAARRLHPGWRGAEGPLAEAALIEA